MVAHGCAWLRMVAHGCTWLHSASAGVDTEFVPRPFRAKPNPHFFVCCGCLFSLALCFAERASLARSLAAIDGAVRVGRCIIPTNPLGAVVIAANRFRKSSRDDMWLVGVRESRRGVGVGEARQAFRAARDPQLHKLMLSGQRRHNGPPSLCREKLGGGSTASRSPLRRQRDAAMSSSMSRTPLADCDPVKRQRVDASGCDEPASEAPSRVSSLPASRPMSRLSNPASESMMLVEEDANMIEKILDVRGGDAGTPAAEYLCKLKGFAHIHARWLPKADVTADGRQSVQRLARFVNKRRGGPLPSRPRPSPPFQPPTPSRPPLSALRALLGRRRRRGATPHTRKQRGPFPRRSASSLQPSSPAAHRTRPLSLPLTLAL